MVTAPELAALFSTFNRVESGAKMPYRAEPAPSRAEPRGGIMAMTPRGAPAVRGPVQAHWRMPIIILSALISACLIAMAVVVGLAGHWTTGVSQNPSWWAGSQQG